MAEVATGSSDEISVAHVIKKTKGLIRYLKSQWISIILIAVLGSIVGIAYSLYKKNTYTATCTFVLEESGNQGGSLSQYAGLASLAGIDLSRNGGGIFQGDNILELYKSRSMIKKTLLTPIEADGRKELLIDRYVRSYNLRKKWDEKPSTKSVTFSSDPKHFTRTQDSIITDLVETINKKMLSVDKLDKKLSIIKVQVTSIDEVFAKEFNDALVSNVNSFYTQTKTKKSSENVTVLQRQADSVKRVLGYSLNGVAAAIDAAPNANPAMRTLLVPSQRRQVDVQASSAIYAEIVKNLEVSKMSLLQETPLIQIIDEPVLPLEEKKLTTIKAALIGLILGAIAGIGFFVVKKVWNSLNTLHA